VINNKEVDNGQARSCAVDTGIAGYSPCFAKHRTSSARYREQDTLTETTPSQVVKSFATSCCLFKEAFYSIATQEES